MDRAIFYSHIRNDPFSGSMTPSQVAGIDALLDAWPSTITLPQMAYVLATVFHETGARMQPIREGFKRTDKEARDYVKRQGYKYAEPDPGSGQVYYGRGLVQLTWRKNYDLMSKRMGLDLVSSPDLMLQPGISARVLFDGMEHGLFTGKALSNYFGIGDADPLNARRIINGLDRAAMVAGYYQGFLTALQAGNGAHVVVPAVERTTPAPRYAEDVKPLASSRTIIGSGITTAATVGGAVVNQIKDADVQSTVDAAPVIGDTATQALQQAQDAVSYTLGVWSYAGIALAVLGLIGVGLVVYSKWERHKQGKA